MANFVSITRKLGGRTLECFIVLATFGLSAYGQGLPQNNTAAVAVREAQDSQTNKMGMNSEILAHTFFKDVGIPGGAGVFNPRLAGLATRPESHTDPNFSSQCATRLTKFIDPHAANDRFPANPHTVAIFQLQGCDEQKRYERVSNADQV